MRVLIGSVSSKLGELEERRLHAENALAALRDSQEHWRRTAML
jgi:hypothetical protein